MWEDILNIVISNGIFATLFVGLLLYLLKDSSKREDKYTNTINSLNENLNNALDIGEKVDEVKMSVEDMKDELDENNQEIGKVSSIAKDIGGKLDLLTKALKITQKLLKKFQQMLRLLKRTLKKLKNMFFQKRRKQNER